MGKPTVWGSHILGPPHKNMMIFHSTVKRHQRVISSFESYVGMLIRQL